MPRTLTTDLVTQIEFRSALRLSHRAFNRAIAAGIVPKPIQVGPRSYRWHRSDIEKFLSQPK